MILPRWYIEQASDYIETVQSGVHSSKEVHDATVRQRKAEYELLKAKGKCLPSHSKPETTDGEPETPWFKPETSLDQHRMNHSQDLRRMSFFSHDQSKVDQSIFFRRRQ